MKPKKLYEVTYNDAAGLEYCDLRAATSANNAIQYAKRLSNLFTKKFYNFEANVVLHNVDGKGKSLAKLKKLNVKKKNK